MASERDSLKTSPVRDAVAGALELAAHPGDTLNAQDAFLTMLWLQGFKVVPLEASDVA